MWLPRFSPAKKSDISAALQARRESGLALEPPEQGRWKGDLSSWYLVSTSAERDIENSISRGIVAPPDMLVQSNFGVGLIVLKFLVGSSVVVRTNNKLNMGKILRSDIPFGTCHIEHNGAEALAGHWFPLRIMTSANSVLMNAPGRAALTRTVGCSVVPFRKKAKGEHTYNRNTWKLAWDLRFPWSRRDERYAWCFYCTR